MGTKGERRVIEFPRCLFEWGIDAGPGLHHRCGEREGHPGPHVCGACGAELR